MARTFKDRSGQRWDVEREHGRNEIVFKPAQASQGEERVAPLPAHGHTQDPYEFSDSELQRLFDRAQPRFEGPKGPSPF